MKRALIVAALLVVAGVIVWATIGGGLQSTVEDRLETEMVARGVPQPMAECMAGRMAERLSVAQIRKLEDLRAQDGETQVPLSVAEFLERVRRVGDNEVVEVTASSAAICAFSGG